MNHSRFFRFVAFLCMPAFSVTRPVNKPLRNFDYEVQRINVTVNLDDRRPISPLLYGIFFEEINHAGDGGLYAEMVKDRSFDQAAYIASQPNVAADQFVHASYASKTSSRKHPNQPLGNRQFSPNPWSTIGNAVYMLKSSEPINPSNTIYAELAVTDGRGGLVNDGYWGIPLKEGTDYHFSAYLALKEGHVGKLAVSMLMPGQDLTSSQAAGALQLSIPAAASGWQKVAGTFKAAATTNAARLALTFEGPGILLVDMVSLFPADHIRAGQLNPWPFRPDILGALKALQPRFVRFPGGCYVEGNDFDSSFYWKKSVGSIDERPGHVNDVWRYWSTDGLGLYEYMLLAEELQAEAVWVINNGVSHYQDVPTKDIQPWVDSALESIEFVTGAAGSKWGSVRAAMGHPEPWQLNNMAIGNEDCGHPAYLGNYMAFYDAIKAKYPHMKLIANCKLGGTAQYELWDYHEYRYADDMWTNLRHAFDTEDMRSGPHIFVSEYAVVGDGWGTLQGAVAEAGFMVGMERNADVVEMGSYAPLLVNVGWVTWLPNMIVFDNHQAVGIPSYWVQQMFSQHQGRQSLAVQVQGAGDKLVAGSSCQDDDCTSIAVQVVNYDAAAKTVAVSLPLALQPDARWLVLTGSSPGDGNSFDEPRKVAPVEQQLKVTDAAVGRFGLDVQPWSVNVVVVQRAAAPSI